MRAPGSPGPDAASGRPRWSIISSPIPSTPAGPTPTASNMLCRRGPGPGRVTLASGRDGVQARLARNAAMSFRRNKKHDYLLRCLLKGGSCGLGIHGCYFPAQGGRIGRRYYRCAGTDPLTTGRETKCTRACIEADALEQSVWDHVVGLLGDPAQLVAQFEQFVAQTATGTQENAACRQLQA